MSAYYLLRVLHRDDQRCGHRVPVPGSNPSYIPARQTGTDSDTAGIPFVCPECGLVSLYSGRDAHLFQSDTPCPFLVGELVLVYIEARCADSNCEARTRIHVVLDGSTRKPLCTKPVSAWEIDQAVKCEHGHPLKSPLAESQRYYLARMPF